MNGIFNVIIAVLSLWRDCAYLKRDCVLNLISGFIRFPVPPFIRGGFAVMGFVRHYPAGGIAEFYAEAAGGADFYKAPVLELLECFVGCVFADV